MSRTRNATRGDNTELNSLVTKAKDSIEYIVGVTIGARRAAQLRSGRRVDIEADGAAREITAQATMRSIFTAQYLVF